MTHRTTRKPARAGRRRTAKEQEKPGAPLEMFTEGSLERASVPEFDLFRHDVGLKTAQRALAVRAGFLEALFADPRVVALCRPSSSTLTAWPGLDRRWSRAPYGPSCRNG